MSALEQTEWDEEAAVAIAQSYPSLCLKDPRVFQWFIVVALFCYITTDGREEFLKEVAPVLSLLWTAVRVANFNRRPVWSVWMFISLCNCEECLAELN